MIDTEKIKQPMPLPETFRLISSLTSSINSTDLGGITATLVDATRTGRPPCRTSTRRATFWRNVPSRTPNIRRMMENMQIY